MNFDITIAFDKAEYLNPQLYIFVNTLKDNIEYLVRVDVLTTRASYELGMVFTAPETIAIYVDESAIIEN